MPNKPTLKPSDSPTLKPLNSSPLEPLKEGWRWVRLGEVCEKPQYGYTASAENEPVGPKFLRITDIQEGRVNWEGVPYCRCGKDLDKYLLRPGDILFARTGGTTGKSYLITEVPPKAIFASYLIRVRTRDDLIPEYLYLFLQSDMYWDQVESNKRGGAQPNMNATLLSNI
ncbi:MAG: restriction endonuclease, partial [Deltaproteobacteria bacterium]